MSSKFSVTSPVLKQANLLYKFLNTNKTMSDEVLSAKMKSLGLSDPKINTQIAEEGRRRYVDSR